MIRKATKEDITRIVELQEEFTRKSRKDIFLKPGDNYMEEQRKYTERVFGKRDSIFYVAEADGKICGYLIGRIKKKPMREIARLGHVFEVFVSDEQRKKGFGKALMEKFFEEMKEKGIEYVDLSVYVNNKEAMEFYERLGYEEYKRYLRKKVKS